MADLRCAVCRKRPSELSEYVIAAKEHNLELTPEDYVLLEEMTLDPQTGLFLCTQDYVKLGAPGNERGIIAVENPPYWEEV